MTGEATSRRTDGTAHTATKGRLAIIGASYLQEPLIETAKSMGYETHVFAWRAGDVGERSADVFYPISIVEKEEILEKCREIGIDGITSIASDLAAVTVNYVAAEMGLTGNPLDATARSTNKHLMRECFLTHGDPTPKSLLVDSPADLDGVDLNYPVIVKPTDRSGSRGITKLSRDSNAEDLAAAIQAAQEVSFEKKALVEEYATGPEYSVEYISWRGEHRFLALTKKYTSGVPHFIETGHVEPAPVDPATVERVKAVVSHALTSLGIEYGASHSEIKIARDGTIRIIEIGGRMGGDFIGSTLVHESTGVDFVKAVVQVAVGEEPDLTPDRRPQAAGVRFVFTRDDVDAFETLRREHPEYLIDSEISPVGGHDVVDSSTRFGYFLMHAPAVDDLLPYLPARVGDEED